MKQFQSHIAVLCALLAAAPWTNAQQPAAQSGPGPNNPRQGNSGLVTGRPRWYSPVTHSYEPRMVPPVNISNSGRLDALLRAGNLYLSLSDTVALAIENNLDIEVERYEFALADSDLKRARAGASILGIPTTLATGLPTGVPGLGNITAGLPSVTTNTFFSSLGVNTFGSPFSFDPAIGGTIQWGHFTQPQQNTITTGTTALVSTNQTYNFGVAQGFVTGGVATLSYNNLDQSQNALRNIYNPVTTSSVDLAITQPLLNGFGLAISNRPIRIARNNLRAADYVFENQVINVVANVVQMYWNLVFFNNDLEVKRRALASSQKLYDDNKKQVEIGTLAPISVVQAEAQMAADQQALVLSQTNVLQQESILKSVLSRNGLASPSVSEAHIVTTDPIRVPAVEASEPVQDLVAMALDNRPELAQSRIQIDSAKINLEGVRNLMLPSLNAVADLRNSGLTGSPNPLIGTPGNPLTASNAPDPYFVGGYGNVLRQLAGRDFPNYSVGVSLNIPLRNRAAQANMATSLVNLRMSELTVQKLINQIRIDVQTALTAVLQARAQYEAATKQRVLQEQTFDAEQKKLAVGASTPYNVILQERDLEAAADAEVQGQAAYILARNQLDLAVGRTLEVNRVEIAEARAGRVSRPPTPLPAVTTGNR
jgi:outer membrane protein